MSFEEIKRHFFIEDDLIIKSKLQEHNEKEYDDTINSLNHGYKNTRHLRDITGHSQNTSKARSKE